MRRRGFAECRRRIRNHRFTEPLVAAACAEGRQPGAGSREADQPGREDDQRKRDVEEENGDEGRGSEPDHDMVAERAPPDAHDRFQHDRQHRRLQAEEQRLDHRHLAEPGVEPAQHHDGDESRQHEQGPGDQATPGPVQQPADVYRELLRLRSRQQHAVVERVQEPAVADPALLLDQDAVHHGDLAGRPAEAERGDLRPHAHRFAERDAVAGRRLNVAFPASSSRDPLSAFPGASLTCASCCADTDTGRREPQRRAPAAARHSGGRA